MVLIHRFDNQICRSFKSKNKVYFLTSLKNYSVRENHIAQTIILHDKESNGLMPIDTNIAHLLIELCTSRLTSCP